MKKSFETCGKGFKSIPGYGIVLGLALTLGFQTLMYYIGVNGISHDKPGMWYGVDPKLMAIDGRIPLVPYFFIQMYELGYGLFPIGAILVSAKITAGKNKEDWINLMLSGVIAIFIGGIILIFFPAYVDKHSTAGVPGAIKDGLPCGDVFEFVKGKNSGSWQLERNFLHEDAPREFGCIPSFHCLNIIFCYLGVMGRKDKNIFHRIGGLLIAILICLSTLFTKQHYIIDVVSAVALCGICFFAVKMFNPGKAMLKRGPNFLIIKKINWSHEKIFVQKSTIENKKETKVKK